jgi:hypothetical protein
MTTLNTYTVRAGNSLPLMCDQPVSQSTGNIVFTFGTECQTITNCGYTNQIIKSTDMCLLGGTYFTATFKGLPGKVNGKIVFQSTLAKKPVLSPNYGQCNNSTTGGGGSLVG